MDPNLQGRGERGRRRMWSILGRRIKRRGMLGDVGFPQHLSATSVFLALGERRRYYTGGAMGSCGRI